MTTNRWAESLLSLPIGTVLSITMKGTGTVLVGTFAGEYTRDMMPALLLDMTDGSSFPQIAVALHTIADAHEIGGMNTIDTRHAALLDCPGTRHQQHVWAEGSCSYCSAREI
jgi:hypothetical protein